MKIRVETIAYYLECNSPGVMEAKLRHMDGPGPLQTARASAESPG